MSDPDDDELDDKTMVMRPSVKKNTPPVAHLRCIDPSVLGGGAGAEVTLDGRAVTVGRSNDSTLKLGAAGVSRNHAKFVPGDGEWLVEDAGSTNGVYVNKSRIAQPTALATGDIVSIGKVHYKVRLAEAEAAPAPAKNVDLTDTEHTMVMQPAVRPAPAAGDATATRTAAKGAAPAAKAAASAASASRERSRAGSGSVIAWVVVVLIGAAIIAGAVYLMI